MGRDALKGGRYILTEEEMKDIWRRIDEKKVQKTKPFTTIKIDKKRQA